MFSLRRLHLRLVLGVLLSASLSTTSAAEKPTPPPEQVPDLRSVNPRIACVGCGEPFDTRNHKKVLDGLVSNAYFAQLRRALYLQDTYHQFESRAHFDNCDFDNAGAYIDELLAEVDRHVKQAQEAKAAKDDASMKKSGAAAFFALGQAVHGIQDFYAHSNFVELQAPKVKNVGDLRIVPLWTAPGRERVRALVKDGLVSGYVWWGLPQRCPQGTPSHEALAKDTDQTSSGKRPVPHFQNLPQYKVAEFLARESTLTFFGYAFKRWPLLAELNGKHVALEALVDRRNGLK